MTLATANVRHFRVGDKTVAATHVWRTHPVCGGSRRFTWIFRLCQVLSIEGDVATIQLVGLPSAPKRSVPASELLPLPAKPEPITFAVAQ